MPDVNIDSIKLEVESDSSDAQKSLDRLSASLMGLNKSLVKIGNNAGGIRKIATSLSSLNNIKIPNFDSMITQLERLSRINLSNLQGKKVNLDIKLSGADEAERMKYAIQDVVESSKKDAKEIAKNFQEAFRLDSKTTKSIEADIRSMFEDIANGGYGGVGLNGILGTLSANGSVSKETFTNYYNGISDVLVDEYKEFIAYVHSHPIKTSDIINETGSGGGGAANSIKENWFKTGLGSFQSKNGASLDTGYFTELLQMFPNVMRGFANVGDSMQTFATDASGYADTTGVHFTNMAESVRQALLSAQAFLNSSVGTTDTSKFIGDYTNDTYTEIAESVQNKINQSMKESASKIPLDVMIDEGRLERQIKSAIERIKSIDFGKIKLKLGVDTTQLKTEVTSAFGKIDSSQLQGVTSELQQMTTTIQQLGDVNTKENGINAFVSAITNLSKGSKEIDITNIQNLFNELASGISALSGIEQIPQTLLTLMSSLNKFARSTEGMESATSKLPALAAEIQSLISVLASTPDFAGVTQLATALATLSTNATRAKDALKTVAEEADGTKTQTKDFSSSVGSVNTIISSTTQNLRSFASGISSIVSSLKEMGGNALTGLKNVVSKVQELVSSKTKVESLNVSFKSLFTTMVGFRGISGIFSSIKSSIISGGDVTEIDHIVKSVFSENMVGYVNDWANNAITKFGIASNAAKKYAGTMTSMFQSSGIGKDESGQMSMRLVELAGDLSAFYNIDTETAYNKIKSGMAGMVRPLRDLGIDLSAATLKEYALSEGITKSYNSMTQGEKIMLRYKYLLEATETQTGDFQRTSESFANSLRTLKAYISSVSTAIGSGLVAAIRPAIVQLNKFMKYLVTAANAFSSFMKTIFGDYAGASGMAIDASSLSDASDYASDLSDSTDDATDSLDDANDSASDLADTMSTLPFDELNQLSKDTSSSSSSSSGSDDDSGLGSVSSDDLDGLLDWGIGEAEKSLSSFESYLNEWAKRIKAAFDAKDWIGLGKAIASGINDGIDYLYDLLNIEQFKEKVTPYIDAFTKSFNSLVDNINWEKLGATIGEGINDIVYAVNRLIDPNVGINWSNLGKKLSEGANGLVDELDFNALGGLFANKLNIVWETAAGFVTNFDWELLGTKLGSGVNSFVNKVDFIAIKQAITEGLNGITSSVLAFLDEFDAISLGTKVANTFKGIISDVKWGEIGSALAGIWNKAWAFLATTIKGLTISDKKGTGIGTAIRTTLGTIVENINVDDMATAISTFVNNVAQDIKEAFGEKETWKGFGAKLGEGIFKIVDGIDAKDLAEAVNAMAGAFLDLIGGAIGYLADNSGEIITKFSDFLANLDWKNIALIALPTIIGSIASAILAFQFTKIKTAMILKFAASLIGVGNSAEVGAAVPSLFSKFKGVIGTVFSTTGSIAVTIGQKLANVFKSVGTTVFNATGTVASTLTQKISEMFSFIGSSDSVVSSATGIFSALEEALIGGAAVGGAVGLTAACVEAGKAMKSLYEIIEGGNGKFTENGETVQQYINKMSTLRDVSKEAEDKLFDLKEAWENGEMDDETFFAKFSEILENDGISASKARSLLEELKKEAGLTDEQMGLLNKTIEGLGESTDQAEPKISDFAGNTEEYAGRVAAAFARASASAQAIGDDETAQSFASAQGYFLKLKESGETVETAFQETCKEFGITGEKAGELATALTSQFGDTGAFATLSGTAESATSTLNGMTEATQGTADSLDMLQEKAETIPTSIKTGVTHTQGMPSQIIDQMSSDMLAKMTRTSNGGKSEFQTEAENIPKGVAQGISDMTWRAIGAINTMVSEMIKKYNTETQTNSPSKQYSDAAENIPKGVAQGIDNKKSEAVTAVANLTSAMKTEFGKFKITTEIDKMFTGYTSKLRSIKSTMYSWGKEIANALKSGMENVHIKTPHIYESGSTRMWTGPYEYWDIPTYSVDWYAKGGLFTKATVAGFGEAGAEAAIPLEDKRALKMIGSAITDNMGYDNDELVGAITQGYVRAMMMNSGNQSQPIINVVCKTENDEVLFRAVERGRESVEYRNNPTPRYSY